MYQQKLQYPVNQMIINMMYIKIIKLNYTNYRLEKLNLKK